MKDVEKFVAELHSKGIFAKAVNVGNIAYHSRYIQPAGPLLLKYLREVSHGFNFSSEGDPGSLQIHFLIQSSRYILLSTHIFPLAFKKKTIIKLYFHISQFMQYIQSRI